jgi:hypothetical protein
MVTHGCQGDHRARLFIPLVGRQGAHRLHVSCTGKERPVDTIAGARKVARET